MRKKPVTWQMHRKGPNRFSQTEKALTSLLPFVFSFSLSVDIKAHYSIILNIDALHRFVTQSTLVLSSSLFSFSISALHFLPNLPSSTPQLIQPLTTHFPPTTSTNPSLYLLKPFSSPLAQLGFLYSSLSSCHLGF